MKTYMDAEVISNDRLTGQIYHLRLKAPDISSAAKPGQFVEIYPKNRSLLLPRPISICDTEANGTISLVFQVVGQGTSEMAGYQKGKTVRILGPLGNGFPQVNNKKIALVGGGIGIPPLVKLAKELTHSGNHQVSVFLGYRGETFLLETFESLGIPVYIATDDGSQGFHGNVISLLEQQELLDHTLYSCGPKVMLGALWQYAKKNDADCFVSMEERMACGIGACVGCAVKVHSQVGFTYQKVCKDGPVFDARDVVWDE